MIKREDIAAHVKSCGDWQTLDQIVASIGGRIPRLEAARYYTERGRRLGKRAKDQNGHRNRLGQDAQTQVLSGRREMIRDRLRELVRKGDLVAKKDGTKFVAYRYEPCVCILWAARAGGYRVQVIRDGEIVEDYSAGNSRHESQTYVPLRSANALSAQEVRWAAKRTAEEMARKFNLAKKLIQEDADLADSLKEDLRGRND